MRACKRGRGEPGSIIRSSTVLPDPLKARVRVSPGGLRSAQAILRRAKERYLEAIAWFKSGLVDLEWKFEAPSKT